MYDCRIYKCEKTNTGYTCQQIKEKYIIYPYIETKIVPICGYIPQFLDKLLLKGKLLPLQKT